MSPAPEPLTENGRIVAEHLTELAAFFSSEETVTQLATAATETFEGDLLMMQLIVRKHLKAVEFTRAVASECCAGRGNVALALTRTVLEGAVRSSAYLPKMARNWEEWFRNSVGPSSVTEGDSRDRTERRVREAIDASALMGHVNVYTKGSYRTNTNVRRDADVDVVVEWKDWSYLEKVLDASAFSWAELGVALHEEAKPPTPAQFRGWVEQALVEHFGSVRVDTSGGKAITLAASSTTLDADVVPCFRFERHYRRNSVEVGTKLFPKSGLPIIGWPEQQRINGNKKNVATSKRYKQVIRALKRLRNDMTDTGRLPQPAPGYFIECLLFNLNDNVFTRHSGYKDTVELVLATVINAIEEGRHNDWAEVNGLKWLWRDEQDWTPQQARDFAVRALKFVTET